MGQLDLLPGMSSCVCCGLAGKPWGSEGGRSRQPDQFGEVISFQITHWAHACVLWLRGAEGKPGQQPAWPLQQVALLGGAPPPVSPRSSLCHQE